MVADLLQIALEFLAEYGLAAVFVLLVLDGAMLMPVLPGEAVMIMAVNQYAQDLGDLAMLVGLATVAAVVGALILYGIARMGGRPLIERHPRLFMMDRRRREKMEETFQKPVGQSLVCFLRVIPLTRIIVNIPAGLARMGVVRFTILSAIGMLAFHSGFMWLAFQSKQPGSAVSEQLTALQQAYATPAWEYLQANEVVAILIALGIGAYLSFRSSKRMLKYPRGAVVSILGWLTARVLLFGALFVWGLVALDPEIVYEIALAGGMDVPAIAARLALDPVRLLAYTIGASGGVGLLLMALEAWAKRRRDAANQRAEAEQEAPEEETIEEPEIQELEPDLEFEESSS